MTENEYQNWNKAYVAASVDLSIEKYARMEHVAELLE